ncbi:MAG: AAA family ATPase [Desulfatitalea sp.]
MPLTRSYQRGLVVGKFSPLHRGHHYLLQYAAERCDELVVISYSNPEYPGCEAGRRARWLADLFPAAVRLVIDPARPKALNALPEGLQTIPPNDAEESRHRLFTGALCTHLLGCTVDAVFTSEAYGDGFAAELTRWFARFDPRAAMVRHVLVDRERNHVPVSGTLVRQDIHAWRQWLSPLVYASFVHRVCLLGGESSGKSTLAQALAHHFGTEFVAEYGRELWERRKGELHFEDMLPIAEEQIRREEQAARRATRYLFCDTSPLTTYFYSHHLFGQADPQLECLAERFYDLVVLCEPDFPFIQDGTRQPSSFRNRQHDWYVQALTTMQIDFISVGGAVEKRVAIVADALRDQ